MRYQILTSSGEIFRTDFEPGEPVRRPDGTVVKATIICTGPANLTPSHVYINADHAVRIIDTDCG